MRFYKYSNQTSMSYHRDFNKSLYKRIQSLYSDGINQCLKQKLGLNYKIFSVTLQTVKWFYTSVWIFVIMNQVPSSMIFKENTFTIIQKTFPPSNITFKKHLDFFHLYSQNPTFPNFDSQTAESFCISQSDATKISDWVFTSKPIGY